MPYCTIDCWCHVICVSVCVCADLTSVALMACGVGTLLHVIRFKLPWTPFYYGTGVVSVLGITTTQIVIGLNSINNLLVSMVELTPLFPALAMQRCCVRIATVYVVIDIETVTGLCLP